MSYLETVSEGSSTVFSNRRKRSLRDDFHEVALPLLDRVYRAALYLTKDKDQAEDLVQETYLRAFRSFERFEPGTNCRAWLLSVMRNLFINRYRQRWREPDSMDWENLEQSYEATATGQDKANTENPETLIFSKLTADEINRAVKDLPEDYRAAIVLVDVQELTYEETAKIMGCPVGTVRSRLFRGRRLLQVALREYALEQGLIKGLTQKDSAPFVRSEKVSEEVWAMDKNVVLYHQPG